MTSLAVILSYEQLVITTHSRITKKVIILYGFCQQSSLRIHEGCDIVDRCYSFVINTPNQFVVLLVRCLGLDYKTEFEVDIWSCLFQMLIYLLKQISLYHVDTFTLTSTKTECIDMITLCYQGALCYQGVIDYSFKIIDLIIYSSWLLSITGSIPACGLQFVGCGCSLVICKYIYKGKNKCMYLTLC